MKKNLLTVYIVITEDAAYLGHLFVEEMRDDKDEVQDDVSEEHVVHDARLFLK